MLNCGMACARPAVEGGFDVIRQRGVVAFNARRTQALQHVKDMFDLEEHAGWRVAALLQAPQMLKLGQHVDQRRVKGRVQQLQIEVRHL